MNGICTLANDRVYHQLVALLNSIEAQMGSIPVCVFPYDNETALIAAEIAQRPQVQLYQDQQSIDRWDQFARDAWDSHPTARQHWPSSSRYYRMGTHRRFCAFDGPFDRFVYLDADTLLLSSLDFVFALLNEQDWVTYDFQFKDLSHVYCDGPRLQQLFSPEQLRSQIFCSGFYAAKRHAFDANQRHALLTDLRSGEAEVLYPMAPDQTLLNYMVMKTRQNYNLALHLPPAQRTGCCVTSPSFTQQDQLLFDRGNRLTYLHYIGLPSQLFSRVCAGENLDFPYRDLFLHYRYRHQPDRQPQFRDRPRAYDAPPSLPQRIMQKLGWSV